MVWNPALEGRGIATQEEMQTFLENMKFEIKREEREINDHNETSGKKKIVNLVLYFTPFEGKYLNYIRRWSTNLYGINKVRNRYYRDNTVNNRLYYQYDIDDERSQFNVRRYGPGGHCIHMGISIYNLSASRYIFGRLRQPLLFRTDVDITPDDSNPKKLYKTFKGHKGKENYQSGTHQYWTYPRLSSGLLRNTTTQDYVCRKYTIGGWVNNTGNPCQQYIRRGLIRPLTPQEAARGYMVFYYTELEKCGCALKNDEEIAQGDEDQADGYCGYVEHMQQRVLTTNCIRGPRHIEHNNRPK